MKTSLFLLNISDVTNVLKKMARIFCSYDREIFFRKCLHLDRKTIYYQGKRFIILSVILFY